MRERKNVVLLFSKLPEVGLVKTRLSVLKDGMFPPETAAELYACMLGDVVEIIGAALVDLGAEANDVAAANAVAAPNAAATVDESAAAPNAAAPADKAVPAPAATGAVANAAATASASAPDAAERVRDTYELVISTTPAANAERMRALFAEGTWPIAPKVIVDEGASFDEHYNHAFAQCWEAGADCILSMGADMPALTKADIRFGFEQLHRLCDTPGGGIVLAPDQEMGVSVIGWTRDTAFTHDGVYYNRDGLTVLPAYIKKARAAGLPALWLPPIPDVDTMADFFHNVTLVHALAYCAGFDDIRPPWRTAAKFTELGFDEIIVAPNDLRDPREHIDV